jgi:hypothetical protein
MNALQHLWEQLGALLPPGRVAELRAQYAEDAQRDQRESAYRKHDRWHRAAFVSGRDPQRSARLAQWLEAHKDWRPR